MEYFVFSFTDLFEEDLLSIKEKTEIEQVEKMKRVLRTLFSCQRERDVEDFLFNKAFLYQKESKTKTFFILNKRSEILAYFALSMDVVYLKSKNFIKRKVDRFNKRNEACCFLIGQIAKNEKIKNNPINLSIILDFIFGEIYTAQEKVGGRLVVLDCKEKMIPLYKKQGFKEIERFSLDEQEQEKDLHRMYYTTKDFSKKE